MIGPLAACDQARALFNGISHQSFHALTRTSGAQGTNGLAITREAGESQLFDLIGSGRKEFL